MVGMSGAAGERLRLVTPSARSFPSFTSGRLDGMLSNIIVTRPPSRSGIALARPLYGTCVMSIPVIVLKSSPETWIDVPDPDDANVILPSRLPRAVSYTHLRAHETPEHLVC